MAPAASEPIQQMSSHKHTDTEYQEKANDPKENGRQYPHQTSAQTKYKSNNHQ